MSSKFIKNSVNYSESELLKKTVIIPILQKYNEKILKSDKIIIQDTKSYFIPNNNKKYYLLITNSTKSTKYKILYFFPDKTKIFNDLESNHITDFFVEINSDKLNFKDSNYLFEGYLYNNNSDYYITDILSINSDIITCNYNLRYTLINNLFTNIKLLNLNGHLSINIHSIFDYNDNYKNILDIFKNNFIYKNEINTIEIINDNNFEKIVQQNINKKESVIKKITKTKLVDVYNVNNIETNNKEGILYIKSLYDSKLLHELLDNDDTINIKCKFNDHFKKWAILYDENKNITINN